MELLKELQYYREGRSQGGAGVNTTSTESGQMIHLFVTRADLIVLGRITTWIVFVLVLC